MYGALINIRVRVSIVHNVCCSPYSLTLRNLHCAYFAVCHSDKATFVIVLIS